MNAIALKNLYGDQLTEAPKVKRERKTSGYANHLGWVFMTNHLHHKPKAARTYKTLFAIGNDYTYFTPNTFFQKQSREVASLRWINAFSVDIDVKHTSGTTLNVTELLDSIDSVGLPEPALIVRTPSGGVHVHWYLDKPKRAFKRVCEHYKRITGLIIEELSEIGADGQANGPERFFRTPTEENTIYQSQNRVSFDDLCDWFSIEQERRNEERKELRASLVNPGQALLHHPAVKKLLAGVCEGQRDNTCYTLALAFKAAGYDAEQTEKRLHDWNKKNDPPLTKIEIKRKVKSAFKPSAPAGPAAKYISMLSGMKFSYQVWEEAKPRHERKYSHLEEWAEDVLAHIRFRGGKISGSQRSLAEEITSSADRSKKIAYSTFKRVLKHLIDAHKIAVETTGKGRGAVTYIRVLKDVKSLRKESGASQKPKKAANNRNGLNSNTILDQVVGGSALPVPPGLAVSLTISPTPAANPTISPGGSAPVPCNVPDRFISALFNRGFTDGRFIFAAWGRVQLAFKAFNIPFSLISTSPDFLNLAIEAVYSVVGEKGAPVLGYFAGQDAFMKYLYGTVKGMLTDYREQQLQDFIRSVEEMPDLKLYCLRQVYFDRLEDNDCVDHELAKAFLDEIESEISARERRKARRKSREKLSWETTISDHLLGYFKTIF